MTAPTIDIAALRALLAAATPGRWTGSPVGILRGPEWVVHNCPGEDGIIMSEPDAALIVAAVNALPALLDRLEAAENCSVDSHCPACLGNVRITRERAERTERENADLRQRLQAEERARGASEGCGPYRRMAGKYLDERDEARRENADLRAKLDAAIDCGAACGTVGAQCQACLRRMFHREVARAEAAEAEVARLNEIVVNQRAELLSLDELEAADERMTELTRLRELEAAVLGAEEVYVAGEDVIAHEQRWRLAEAIAACRAARESAAKPAHQEKPCHCHLCRPVANPKPDRGEGGGG